MERLVMPSYGISEAGGTVVRWLKAVGDPVRRGEPVVEVETEKAVTELESPGDGVILEIAVAEGEHVENGGLLALIGEPGEKPAGAAAPAAAAAGDGRAPVAAEPGSGVSRDEGAQEAPRVRAAPAARRLAARHGIDLHTIRGTGPYGRVLVRDVEAAIAAREAAVPKAQDQAPSVAAPSAAAPAAAATGAAAPAAASPAAAEEPPAPGLPGVRSRMERASTVRRVTAQRLTESVRNIPHFYLTATVTAEELLAAKERLAARGSRVSVTALLLPRIAEALRAHPALNASWRDGYIEYYEDINVGVAVDTPRGLLVPVIRHVDRKVPVEIHTELRALAEQARTGSLPPDRLAGGTFTVTNLGMWRVDEFIPIINPPQAAILAVGRISQRPVVRDGFLGAAAQMTVTLGVDHRVADGADAARFLDHLCRLLETPWP